jgi:hypothetical protein
MIDFFKEIHQTFIYYAEWMGFDSAFSKIMLMSIILLLITAWIIFIIRIRIKIFKQNIENRKLRMEIDQILLSAITPKDVSTNFKIKK